MGFGVDPACTAEPLNLGIDKEIVKLRVLECLNVKSDHVYIDFLDTAKTFFNFLDLVLKLEVISKVITLLIFKTFWSPGLHIVLLDYKSFHGHAY